MQRLTATSLLIAVLAACVARTDDPRPAQSVADSSRRPVGRAVAVGATVRVETLAVTPLGVPPVGPAYDRAIAAFVGSGSLAAAGPLAPDDTDITNYQAAGGWMRGNDTSARGRNRFAIGYERFTAGVLVLRLDTLLERERKETPFETAGADSLAVAGLARAERVADECRLLGFETDQHIVGLLPSDTVGVWMRPRLAWYVDTVAARFRPLRPDSLACWLPPDRDR